MGLSAWLHAKLKYYDDWIIVLGALSSIFTLAGYSMPSLWDHLFEGAQFSLVAATLNTIIALIVIRWGLAQKNECGKANQKIEECQKLEERAEQLLQSERERHKQEIASLHIDGINAIKEAQETCSKLIKEEREKAERLLLNERDRANRLQKTLDDSMHQQGEHQKAEKELLIEPLYMRFKKYPDIRGEEGRICSGLPRLLSLVEVDPDIVEYKADGADCVNDVIKIMEQHYKLAQPRLQELISQYLELRSKQAWSRDPHNGEIARDMYGIISSIVFLVKARHCELVGSDETD
jgi:hypothetical protein